MSLPIKYVFVQGICLNAKKFCHGFHRLSLSGRKQCFLLGAYKRLKKETTEALVECNVNICELTSKLEQITEELKALETKLHCTEERIRKLKRKFCQFIFFHINTRAPTSLIVYDQKCSATE